MRHFGSLQRHRRELQRIDRTIEEEFESITTSEEVERLKDIHDRLFADGVG